MRQESLQSRLTQNINQRNQIFGNVSYQRTTTDSNSALRLRGSEPLVGHGCAGELEPSDRPAHVAAPALSVHAPDDGNETVLRIPDERLGRGRHQRQQPGTGELGPAESQFLQRHRRAGRRPAAIHPQPGERRRAATDSSPAAGTTSPSAATFAVTTSTSSRSRIRGEASRLPAALTGPTSLTSCWAFRARARSRYGNADKYLRGFSYDAYITDDWRVGPALTITAGARWEYESPLTRAFGRLVNLDIASGLQGDQPRRGDRPDRVAHG